MCVLLGCKGGKGEKEAPGEPLLRENPSSLSPPAPDPLPPPSPTGNDVFLTNKACHFSSPLIQHGGR